MADNEPPAVQHTAPYHNNHQQQQRIHNDRDDDAVMSDYADTETTESFVSAEPYIDPLSPTATTVDGYETANSLDTRYAIEDDEQQLPDEVTDHIDRLEAQHTTDTAYNTEPTPTATATTAADQFFSQFSLEAMLKQKTDADKNTRDQFQADIRQQLDTAFPDAHHDDLPATSLLDTVTEGTEQSHDGGYDQQQLQQQQSHQLPTIDQLANDHTLFSNLMSGNDDMAYKHGMVVLGQNASNIRSEAYKQYRTAGDRRDGLVEQMLETHEYHGLFADDVLSSKETSEPLRQKYDAIAQLRADIADSQLTDEAGSGQDDLTVDIGAGEHVMTIAELSDEQLRAQEVEFEQHRLTAIEAHLQRAIQYKAQLYVYEHSQRVALTQVYNEKKQNVDKLRQQYIDKKYRLIEAEIRRYAAAERHALAHLQRQHHALVVDKVVDAENDAEAVIVQHNGADAFTSKYTLPTKQYRIYDQHTPRILRVRVDYVRGLRAKVQPGNYVVMCTLYNRLNGQPLRYTAKHQQTVTPISQYHAGQYFSNELCYNQQLNNRIFMPLPSVQQSNPYMCMLFELYYVGNLQPGINSNTDNVVIDNTIHCVGYAVMPCVKTSYDLVQGQFVLPMVRGRYSADQQVTYGGMQSRVKGNVEEWLCNMYIDCRQYAQYMDYEICDYVQLQQKVVSEPTQQLQQPIDDDDIIGQSLQPSAGVNDANSTAVAIIDPYRYELDSVSNRHLEPYSMDRAAFAAQHTTDDVYDTAPIHVTTVEHKSDRTVKDSVYDDILNDAHRIKRNRPTVLTGYQVNILPDGETVQLTGQHKWNYVRYELMELAATRRVAFRSLLILCACLWIRVYIHYAGQIVYALTMIDLPSYTVKAYTVVLDYDPLAVSTLNTIALVAVPCVATLVVFIILAVFVYLIQIVQQTTSQLLCRLLLIYGIACMLDPAAVLFIDAVTQNWTTGDAFILYNIYQGNTGMEAIAALFTAFLYIAYMSVTALCMYTYIVYVHMGQCVLDHYAHMCRRTNYAPNDSEVSLNDVLSVIDQCKHSTHDRKYRINLDILHQGEDTVYHVAVFNELNDDELELYRHFLVYNDGTCCEVIDAQIQFSTVELLREQLQQMLDNDSGKRHILIQTAEQAAVRRSIVSESMKAAMMSSRSNSIAPMNSNSFAAKSRRLNEQREQASVAPKIETISLDDLLGS